MLAILDPRALPTASSPAPLRAALIETINKGVTKVASLERVPPDLEEILRTATGISAGINLQEEE